MLYRLKIAHLVLLLCGSLMGCASAKTPPPEAPPAQIIKVPDVQIKNIYPDIPAEDLSCLPEPTVPAMLSTEVMADLWVNQTVDAGADCRSKLATIRGLVNSWPKE